MYICMCDHMFVCVANKIYRSFDLRTRIMFGLLSSFFCNIVILDVDRQGLREMLAKMQVCNFNILENKTNQVTH